MKRVMKELQNRQKKFSNMATITLKTNRLNFPQNKKKQSGWMDKGTSVNICCLQETHFRFKDTNRVKVKGQKRIFHANGNQKRAGLAILTSKNKEALSQKL